jgi:MFS family permease
MVFLANMGWGVMAPVLANVQAEFEISVVEVALANSIFGVARLILDLPIGVLMDRIDQKWLRFSGAAILSLGSVMCALATTFPLLLSGRLLNGAGAAIIQVTNLVWISRLSTDERRGRDLGIYQAILQAGASLSPLAGGVLADQFGWRASFWFAAGVALLGFLPMLVGPQEWIGKVKAGDKPKKRAEKSADAARTGGGSMRLALIVANVVTFVLFFSVGGFQNTVVPLFGSEIIHLDAGAIGLALGVSTLVRFVMSLVGGELSDRFGRRAVLIPGLLVIGVGTLLFNLATDGPTFWLALLVLSVGRFGNNVPATVLADNAPPHRWGLLMGINRTVGDLGLILGPVAMGLMLENGGYSFATIVSAVFVWACVLEVIVGVSESRRGGAAPATLGAS